MISHRLSTASLRPYHCVLNCLQVAARSFNSLEFKAHSVTKYSPYHIIDGEAYWYQVSRGLQRQSLRRIPTAAVS